MLAALICKEYGWTREQYLDQPAYWLDIITSMLQAEGAGNKNN